MSRNTRQWDVQLNTEKMDKGFWDNLKKPVIGLAPMDGVTDAAFRYITAKYGAPAISITEFTSVEGIEAGAIKTLEAFIYDEIERPIVAQIFGHTPEAFYKAAFVISELGFDGIDINMGCPAKNIASRGSGAALIKTPTLAKEIIKKTKQGASDWANGKKIETISLPESIIAYIKLYKEKHSIVSKHRTLPVSIKTRIGFDDVVIEEWIKHLLETEPVNISIHGRTLKQMYSGSADWEMIAKAAKIARQSHTTVLGNGDIKDLNDANLKIKQYGVDGILIGRAAFGNPWVFKNKIPTLKEKFTVAIEHAKVYEEIFVDMPAGTLLSNLWPSDKLFMPMRKHLSWYCRGFENAGEVRKKLMETKNTLEVTSIIEHLQQK